MTKEYLKDSKELMKDYNYSKNADVDLEKITAGMGIKIWWKCFNCGYEWQTRVNHRTKDKTGCPKCKKEQFMQKQIMKYKERLKKENLLITYPEIAKEWNYEKNNGLLPENFLPGVGTSVWWKCSRCGYEWKTRINHRTKDNSMCQVCSRKQAYSKLLKLKGSLAQNYPDLLLEWNYEKNSIINPSNVTDGSNRAVWWKCSKCGYEYKARITSRVHKNTGCRKCGQKKGKETLIKNLIEKKGALLKTNPKLAKEWNYEKNNGLLPSDVLEHSPKKVWWKCSKCGYEWEMSLYNRSLGGNCPKCLRIEQSIAKATPILGINDLESQNPELTKEFHPTKNNGLTPKDITVSSNKKVWWLGKCGHEWQSTPGSRKSGRGCPICFKEFKISFPEKTIYFYINKALIDEKILENYKIQNQKGKEIDIYIPKYKIGIEYDGYNWHKDYNKDLQKDIICNDLNITLIRVRENKCQQYESNSIKLYIKDNNENELRMLFKR